MREGGAERVDNVNQNKWQSRHDRFDKDALSIRNLVAATNRNESQNAQYQEDDKVENNAGADG